MQTAIMIPDTWYQTCSISFEQLVKCGGFFVKATTNLSDLLVVT